MTDAVHQLIAQLISAFVAALLIAVIIRFATKWIAKFTPPFGMAYQAALVATMPSIFLGFVVSLLVVSATTTSGASPSAINQLVAIPVLLAIVLGFFVQIFVYGKVIKHPDTGAIGLRKALYVSGIQLLIGIVIIGALAAISIPAYQKYVTRAKQAEARQSSVAPRFIENKLIGIANEVTRSAPKMLDTDTRLDGAVAGPGLKFTYLYTLPNIESAQVAPGVFNTKLARTIENSACGSSQLKPFFDSNVSVIYDYRGKDGSRIGSVEVNRIKCGLK